MIRVFSVLAVVILMIAAVAPAVFAEGVNQSQVVKMTEAEWENFGAGSNATDNMVAFYNEAPDTISTTVNSTVCPMDLRIYSDLVRATVDWTFYLVGDLADYDLCGYLIDGSGNPLTLWVNFQHLTANLAKVTFFHLPNAYIVGTSLPDTVQLELWLSSYTITQPCAGQFYMLPNTVRMRPRPSLVTPDTLWGSYVLVTPEEEAYVTITQCPLSGQTYEPGDINVQTMAWDYYSNVPTQIQQFNLSISCNDTAAIYFAWLNNQIKNVRIQCPGFTSTPLDIADMSWMENGWVECEINNYVTLPVGSTFFEVICDFDSSLSTGDYYFSLGNSAYCFSPTSIKNLNNNQYIWNITPSTQITWGPVNVSEPGEVIVTQGPTVQQTLVPSINDVTLDNFTIISTVDAELRNLPIEIHWRDSDDSLYIFDWLLNLYITSQGEQTPYESFHEFVLYADQNYAYLEFDDYYFYLSQNQPRDFQFKATTSWMQFTDSLWVVVGNTAAGWCLSSTSVKNIVNNQFITNITPVTPLQGPGFSVMPAGQLLSYAYCLPPSGLQLGGSAMNYILGVRFHALFEPFTVNKVCGVVDDPITWRDVESITIKYITQSGGIAMASASLIQGKADFNITCNPMYVEMDGDAVLNGFVAPIIVI